MALTDPTDTLAHHASRVFTTQRDMSATPLKATVARLSAYMQDDDVVTDTKPENEAMWFYGLNHGMALIGQSFDALEPLSTYELDFVNTYHRVLGPKAVRAFYYLLLICTREARHCQNIKQMEQPLKELFGAETVKFMSSGSGEGGIHKNLLDKPPETTLGNYVSCVRHMFYNCSWSSGYGGKKWGKVTDCLVNFVNGTFSAEMMMDTVWTLAHNGGPIFNKGHLYGMYSPQLTKLLDVQRSGQIPLAAVFDKSLSAFVDPDLLKHMKTLVKKHQLGTYVDWDVVEALGSVQKYYHEKKIQHAEHGLSPEAKALKVMADQKHAADQAKLLAQEQAAAAAYGETHYEVIPGVVVKKVAIQRAA